LSTPFQDLKLSLQTLQRVHRDPIPRYTLRPPLRERILPTKC